MGPGKKAMEMMSARVEISHDSGASEGSGLSSNTDPGNHFSFSMYAFNSSVTATVLPPFKINSKCDRS